MPGEGWGGLSHFGGEGPALSVPPACRVPRARLVKDLACGFWGVWASKMKALDRASWLANGEKNAWPLGFGLRQQNANYAKTKYGNVPIAFSSVSPI